jgi:hypothetical protein
MSIRFLRSALAGAVLLLGAASGWAAQSGERSPYDTNPKCRERDAKPEDCVIDDGPSQYYPHRQQKPVQPAQLPARPAPKPPEAVMAR